MILCRKASRCSVASDCLYSITATVANRYDGADYGGLIVADLIYAGVTPHVPYDAACVPMKLFLCPRRPNGTTL